MNKWFIISIIILSACSSSTEKSLLQQSAEIHDSSVKVSEQVVRKIREINLILEKSDVDLTVLKDSIAILKQDFIDWESSLIEVPGYEHEHDHHAHDGHDHDHSNHSSADLTPKMMLEVQKDLNVRILQLDARSRKMLISIQNQL